MTPLQACAAPRGAASFTAAPQPERKLLSRQEARSRRWGKRQISSISKFLEQIKPLPTFGLHMARKRRVDKYTYILITFLLAKAQFISHHPISFKYRFTSFIPSLCPLISRADSGCTNHAAEAALELKVIVLAIGYATQVSRAIYCLV